MIADAALIWVGMGFLQSSFMNLTDIPTINAKMRSMIYSLEHSVFCANSLISLMQGCGKTLN